MFPTNCLNAGIWGERKKKDRKREEWQSPFFGHAFSEVTNC
jgi:hypothetical protein